MDTSETVLWAHMLLSIRNGKHWEPIGRFFYCRTWSGKILRDHLSGVVSRANTTEILSLCSIWAGTTQSFATNLHIFRLQLSKKGDGATKHPMPTQQHESQCLASTNYQPRSAHTVAINLLLKTEVIDSSRFSPPVLWLPFKSRPALQDQDHSYVDLAAGGSGSRCSCSDRCHPSCSTCPVFPAKGVPRCRQECWAWQAASVMGRGSAAGCCRLCCHKKWKSLGLVFALLPSVE